jgi:hypothetical protein
LGQSGRLRQSGLALQARLSSKVLIQILRPNPGVEVPCCVSILPQFKLS